MLGGGGGGAWALISASVIPAVGWMTGVDVNETSQGMAGMAPQLLVFPHRFTQ